MVRNVDFLSGAKLAVRLGLTEHLIRRAVARGVLSPSRVGNSFAFPADEIPAIRAKLVEAGLITAPAVLPIAPAGPIA